MDPLTDVISRLSITKQKAIAFDVSRNANFTFPEYTGVKVYIINEGSFFLRIQSTKVEYSINKGDVLVLSGGSSFSIYDNEEIKPTDVTSIRLVHGKTSYFSDGGADLSFIGCRFAFKINDSFSFLRSLPDPIIIHTDNEESKNLKNLIIQLADEIKVPDLGSQLVTEYFLHIILLKSLRLLIHSNILDASNGWFYAISDRKLKRAISLIHESPGRKWRINELADSACMSRTAFTSKFRLLTGYSVTEYIRKWRFNLAIERAVKNNEKFSAFFNELGYNSESSFSTAFKRTMGESPNIYIKKMLDKNNF